MFIIAKDAGEAHTMLIDKILNKTW
jgi:hypothetical protein